MVQKLHQMTQSSSQQVLPAAASQNGSQKNMLPLSFTTATAGTATGSIRHHTSQEEGSQQQQQTQSLFKQKKATIKKKHQLLLLDPDSHAVSGQGHEDNYLSRNHRSGGINAIAPSETAPAFTPTNNNQSEFDTDLGGVPFRQQLSQRRQSNLPGIPSSSSLKNQTQKINDQNSMLKQGNVVNLGTHAPGLKATQQQTMLEGPQSLAQKQQRAMMMGGQPPPAGSNGGYIPRGGATIQEEEPIFLAHSGVPSRNKGGARGPKTIVNRTQVDELPTSSRASPEHFYGQQQPRVKEMHSTMQLIQATYQPQATAKFRQQHQEQMMNHHAKMMSGTVAYNTMGPTNGIGFSNTGFGGASNLDLPQEPRFGATMQSVKHSAQLELKTMKRTEYATKRQSRLKPPILPPGIVAPTQGGGRVQYTPSYFTSPDDRLRLQQHGGSGSTKFMLKNRTHFQPNTVRDPETVVQHLNNHSSISNQQQQPRSLGPPENRGGIQRATSPQKMTTWFASPQEQARSNEPGPSSPIEGRDNLVTKRTLVRAQAIIKVRKNEQQTAVKLATLRQNSNEASGAQRDRNSLASQLPLTITKTIDCEEEDDDEAVDHLDVVATTAFQRVMQMRNNQLNLKSKRRRSRANTNGTASDVLSRNSPLIKLTANTGGAESVESGSSNTLHPMRNETSSLMIGSGGEQSLNTQVGISTGGAGHLRNNRLPPSLTTANNNREGLAQATTTTLTSTSGGSLKQQFLHKGQLTQEFTPGDSLEALQGSQDSNKKNAVPSQSKTRKIVLSKNQIITTAATNTGQQNERFNNHRPSQGIQKQGSIPQNGSTTTLTRTFSQPNNTNGDQQSLSNSSKIDRILAKIDKQRSESNIMKNGGIVFSKKANDNNDRRESNTQLAAAALGRLQLEESPSLIQRLAQPPGVIELNRVQTEGIIKKQGSDLTSAHQKKILKIISNSSKSIKNMPETAAAHLAAQMIMSKKKTMPSGVSVKFKASQERPSDKFVVPTTLGGTGGIVFPLGGGVQMQHQLGTKQISIKQIRDTRSQDVALEKHYGAGGGFYLPQDHQQMQQQQQQYQIDREFSPNDINPKQEGNPKKMAKQKIIRGVNFKCEESNSANSNENGKQPLVMRVISNQGHQQDHNNILHPKPMKKSILHSMQPHGGGPQAQGGGVGGVGQFCFSSGEMTMGSSDKQSTEISSNPPAFYNQHHNTNLGATNFDQSSLCIHTSASGQNFDQHHVVLSQHNHNHMTIQDQPGGGTTGSNSPQQFGSPVAPAHSVFGAAAGSAVGHQVKQRHGGARTSIRENPLECSSSTTLYLKKSSRYVENQQAAQINEEPNEEKDSSSNSNSNKPAETLTKRGKQHVIPTAGGTMNTSSAMIDLQIEPIDSEDKLFKEISTLRKRRPSRLNQFQQSSGGYIRGAMGKQLLLSSSDNKGGNSSQNSRLQVMMSRVLSQNEKRYSEMDDNARTTDRLYCDENDDELVVDNDNYQQEDDEAVEIKNPHHAKATAAAFQTSTDILALPPQKSSVDKKKHWLLDSSRFDIVLQNQNHSQRGSGGSKSNDQDEEEQEEEEEEVHSDTVIFEKDYNSSSMAGTPPKISQAHQHKKQHQSKKAGEVKRQQSDEDDSNSSSQIVIKNTGGGAGGPPHQYVNSRVPQNSVMQRDRSPINTKRGAAGTVQVRREESVTLSEAQQAEMVAALLAPLVRQLGSQHLQLSKQALVNDQVLSEIALKLNIDQKDSLDAPTNPHWVMQKQVRMLPNLDHYLKPTYYDVIYLQPHLEGHNKHSVLKSSSSAQSIGDRKDDIITPKLEKHFNFDLLLTQRIMVSTTNNKTVAAAAAHAKPLLLVHN